MNFNDLLEILGYTDGEHLAVCWQKGTTGSFRSAIHEYDSGKMGPVGLGDELLEAYDGPGINMWFGINPMAGPARESAGRGTVLDVTRLAAVWADLDVKAGGCQSEDVARAIIGELSSILGAAPSAIVHSGHGLQPYWPIEDAPISDGDGTGRAKAVALVRRFGRLVSTVAQSLNAGVDSVFDLPRIMRLPGSTNNKGTPIPTHVEQGTGGPITLQQLADALDEYGVAEQPDDAKIKTRALDTSHADYIAPGDWPLAAHDCGYIKTVIDGWASDVPDNKGRHPWHLAQAARISAAHRNGCLSAEGLGLAYRQLAHRFAELCVNGIGGSPRPVRPAENAESMEFGNRRASTMSKADVASELGGHLHLTERVELSRQGPQIAGQTSGDVNMTALQSNESPDLRAASVRKESATKIVWPEHVADQPVPPAEDTGTDGPTPQPEPLALVVPIRPNVAGITRPASPTDSGNTDLMVALHRDRLRYCPESGAWLTWDGARWQMGVDDGAAFTAARASIDAITLGDEQLDKHVMRSLSRNALGAMVALGQRHPDMRVALAQLDGDPYKLNTPDGVLDLRTGTRSPHDRDGWHTKIAGAGYGPGTPVGRWQRFLATTFGGDAELIGYVQRLAGYAACGVVTEHVLPFLFGGGQNGKGVFLEVLTRVLGDYAISAPATFLLAGKDEHATEIARLHGARLVVCSEINRESKFDEAKIKMLTGGDQLSGRFMRQDFFNFMPTHTLILMGNHQPEVSAGGTSFWRRLRLIPFNHTVPDAERVDGLAEKLVTEEGSGILAWIAQGAADVLTSGMRAPESVMAATTEYAEQEDAVGRFVEECCVRGTAGGTLKTVNTAMLARYQRWARLNGADDLNIITLGRELAARFGIKTTTTGGVRSFRGISLIVDDQPLFGEREQTP